MDTYYVKRDFDHILYSIVTVDGYYIYIAWSRACFTKFQILWLYLDLQEHQIQPIIIPINWSSDWSYIIVVWLCYKAETDYLLPTFFYLRVFTCYINWSILTVVYELLTVKNKSRCEIRRIPTTVKIITSFCVNPTLYYVFILRLYTLGWGHCKYGCDGALMAYSKVIRIHSLYSNYRGLLWSWPSTTLWNHERCPKKFYCKHQILFYTIRSFFTV